MNRIEIMIGIHPTGRCIRKTDINYISNNFVIACMRGDDYAEEEAFKRYNKILALQHKETTDGN